MSFCENRLQGCAYPHCGCPSDDYCEIPANDSGIRIVSSEISPDRQIPPMPQAIDFTAEIQAALDILPCPFCGTPAKLEAQFGRDWWVQCCNEDCNAASGEIAQSPQEARDWWNRRAAESQGLNEERDEIALRNRGMGPVPGIPLAVLAAATTPEEPQSWNKREIARIRSDRSDLLEALRNLLDAYTSAMHSEFDFPGGPWTPERDNDTAALAARAAIRNATSEPDHA